MISRTNLFQILRRVPEVRCSYYCLKKSINSTDFHGNYSRLGFSIKTLYSINICVTRFFLRSFHRNDCKSYGKIVKPQDVPKIKNEKDPVSIGKVFFETRKAKVEELKQHIDTHPYPNKYQISCTISEYVNKYEYLKNEETLDGVSEAVAGRILSIRKVGSKLYFFDLQSDGAKLQVKLYEQMYESKEKFVAEISKYHRGDIIGIEGSPSRTKSGELSINSKTVICFEHSKIYLFNAFLLFSDQITCSVLAHAADITFWYQRPRGSVPSTLFRPDSQ